LLHKDISVQHKSAVLSLRIAIVAVWPAQQRQQQASALRNDWSRWRIITAEMADTDGQTLKIPAYLDIPPSKQIGAPNEPVPHYYYHRPLHQLLGEVFTGKLVLA
jgi:hypothetical protein